MNVRFYAGSKKQYIGIARHDPTALYFCHDTRELFWGDKLLSDGIRIVATKNDLPSFDAAANGIIYYVVDCRNGYVLSQDRASWVQVIYAPAADISAVPESEAGNTAASVAAIRTIENTIYEKIASIENLNKVKTISFAGVALDFANGVFSIDRDAARKALGISFTEGQNEQDIEIVATKEYVDTQIANVSKIDLNDYAKKSDLEGLATKDFVKEAISEAELADKDINLDDYYTKSEVDKLIPDTSSFVTKDEIPSVEGLASEKFVEDAVKDLASTEYVDEKVAAIEHPAELYVVDYNAPNYAEAVEAYNSGKLLLLTNAAPDSNSYAMMNYVSEKYITFTKFLMSRSEAYGAFNTYYLKPDNGWEVSSEVILNKVEATIDETSKEIDGIIIGKNTYSFDGFASVTTVNQITQDIEHIENTYVTNETLENNYISNTELEEKNYVTTTEVTERVEEKVTEVIEKKIEDGNIVVNTDAINYDTW
jgi:hypothetical protein